MSGSKSKMDKKTDYDECEYIKLNNIHYQVKRSKCNFKHFASTTTFLYQNITNVGGENHMQFDHHPVKA